MAGTVGLENARPTAFLERGNAEVGRPNFGVVGLVEFLKGDEAVRGQEQANARNGEQKEERLMQVGVLSKEPLDLPFQLSNLIAELLDVFLEKIFSHRGADHLALESLKGIQIGRFLVSRAE